MPFIFMCSAHILTKPRASVGRELGTTILTVLFLVLSPVKYMRSVEPSANTKMVFDGSRIAFRLFDG